MSQDTSQYERGQNLVIFAVIMVVMIALAALVIDGGFGYTNRREAQNAADAGALAGAEALCSGNPDLAEPQALDYAINRNGAGAAEAFLGSDAITVTTTITQQTFLAGIFGADVVTTTAIASAGCYVPCNIKGVLPVAWACQPPAGEVITDTCAIEYGTPTVAGPLYVIMDSQSVDDDFFCKDPPNNTLPEQDNWLDCDVYPVPNDGLDDVFASGNRSWLDLSGGGGGADELKDWIWNGFGGTLHNHMWFGGQSGVANSVFQAVGDIIGTIVWLPVFDSYCEGVPDVTAECIPYYHAGTDTIVISGGTSQFYFHVIAYSAFRITCVVAPGVPHTCSDAGRQAAEAANPTLQWNSIKTIEGYFLEDYGGSGKCEGPNAGVYTIYLDR